MSASESAVTGLLELRPGGDGHIRESRNRYRVMPGDVAVPSETCARLGLRPGTLVTGTWESRGDSRRRLVKLLQVEGKEAREFGSTRRFEDLTPIDPTKRLRLETGKEPLSMRVLDLLTPVGKGQRGLIVAPPRSGKTILLQQIAASIAANHPEVHLLVLLVDERPEEVTDMRRSVKGEVAASSNDQSIEEHIRIAELTLERAKRLAENGEDVLVLLDSLTRLARAYNKESNTGRTMTGGVDIKALDIPKRLFGAARCFEEGGSLTILATCLIETGSRMDDLIFQEFKGTGNMEIVLDRKLAERRVWPAIDIALSGTRKEERLLEPETLRGMNLLRRTLSDFKTVEAMEALVQQLEKTESNAAFLDKIAGKSKR